MSKENVKLFMEKVQTDEGLQIKIKNVLTENQEIQFEQLVRIGEELGLSFSADECSQAMQEALADIQKQDELDPAQLETVAGGFGAIEGEARKKIEHNLMVSILTFTIGCEVSVAINRYSTDECAILY